ncbi:unnamed protein product [Caenorhabditis nigoni]
MKELVWNKGLAQEVQESDGAIPINRQEYVEWLGNSTYEERFNKFLDQAAHIRRNPDKSTHVDTAHYLFSLVENIGCYKVLDGNFKGLCCFLTPAIPFEYLENSSIKPEYLFLDSGEAGSKCENGYENDDGLCIIIKPTTSTVSSTTKKQAYKTLTASISVPNQDVNEHSENDFPTEPSSSYSIFSLVHILVALGESVIDFTQIERSNCQKKMRLLFLALFIFPLVSSDWTGPEFVEKLNKGRKEFAKKEKVPNMRELVWSEDLVQQANKFSGDPNNEERYEELSSGFTFEEKMDRFFNGREGANLMVRNLDPFHRRRQILFSYFLFPLFDKVGCDHVFWNQMNRTLCYWTPGISEKDLSILNSKQPERIFIFNGEAGSKCDNGYENNDGLCKATTSTVTTNTKEKTTGNSGNNVLNEPSFSCSLFSVVHILVVLGFGYSIFT